MDTRQTPAQKEALRDKGPETEKKVKLWPEEQEYRIEYWHEMKKSPLPYDILATKGKESWIIDVKTGVKPGINISNVQKILNSKELKGYKKAGLALVSETIHGPTFLNIRK